MSKLCKDCACELVCGITHTPELYACANYKAEAFTEIEKLKAEIQTLPQVHIKTGVMSLDTELVVSLNKVIEKLDNRIKELKGENNE